MAGWPQEVITKVHEYFPAGKALLNVVSANEISAGERNEEEKIFGSLQTRLYDKTVDAPEKLDAITKVVHAPLAVKVDKHRCADNKKVSDVEPLLNLAQRHHESLKLVINCLVKKVHHHNNKATFLETSKGDFKLGNAKLILAMGTLPPTTLMLNSFPTLSGIGERFSAHFMTIVTARTPLEEREADFELKEGAKLSMGAVYIAGKHSESKHQFSMMITGVTDAAPEENFQHVIRHHPNLLCIPSVEQLASSTGHTVLHCGVLGQVDHNNPQNWFHSNEDEDITSNATLQVLLNDTDRALWDTMDASAFVILEDYLANNGGIEYWNPETSSWQAERPTTSQIRLPGLVHESSTMWIGESESDPVDLDYKFRGVDNVYLTGGALWPTGASWNPTCAMTGLAMDLADRLNKIG